MVTIPLNSTMSLVDIADCDAVIDMALAAYDFPIVFDCVAATGIDSMVIDYIIKTWRRAEEGGDVEVINADDLTQETLDLVGVSRLVKVM